MKNHCYKKFTKILISSLVISAAVFISATTALPQKTSAARVETAPEKQVREFVAAFNARDIDRMLEAVDEKIQWLNVDGAKIGIEAEGKKSLRESMESYFRDCASCKSNLEWMQSAGSRITALERASWTGKNGRKSQSSLSVYEFREGKIFRVYYFPADTDKTPTANK